ncbi:MAG: hypothetical protein IT449_07275 [Phycisphaerales bacterium]|nr:hypothetical protein [Phycisphaerales bacterium]
MAFVRMVRRETEKLTPLLRQVRTVQQHEGRKVQYETVEGFQEQVSYENKASTALKVHRDEFPTLDNVGYLKKAKEMAAELAKQEMGHFFAKADYFIEKAGTTLDAGGKPFDPMMLVEGLEKVDIDFDEQGRPILPTLVSDPALYAAAAPRLAEAEKSADFQRRWKELMERKRMEWRDREADRKLAE